MLLALLVSSALASDPTVRFVGDGAQITTFDAAGAVASCTAPCELQLDAGPKTFLPPFGGRPLVLDQSAAGRVYRVAPGHPGRRKAGLIVSSVGLATGLILMSVDVNTEASVGAVPYFASAALSGTGFALTIGTRAKFVEE